MNSDTDSFGVEIDDYAKDEIKIKVRQADRRQIALHNTIDNLSKRLSQTENEAQFFISEFERLGGKSALKSMDDEKAQLEFWSETYKQKLNLALLLQKPIDPELVKLILCLQDDAEVKQQTVKLLEQIRTTAIHEQQLLNQRRQDDKNLQS